MTDPQNSRARDFLAKVGYKLVKIATSNGFKPNQSDKANIAAFVPVILPAVQHNAATNRFPSPKHMKKYFTPWRAASTRLLLDQCEAEGVRFSGRRVFDLGCHAGYLLWQLSVRYSDVRLYGGDISEDKLAMARRACPEANVFRCNVWELSVDSPYDVIFLTHVLEHLVNPEAAIRKMLDATAPGGTIVLAVPDGREDHSAPKYFHERFASYGGHINFWSPESWRYFLERTFPDTDVRTAKLAVGDLFAAITKR